MNRLVIIGNGFDLAHGLPTSYRSFINFVWNNLHNLDKIPQIKKLFTLEHPIHDSTRGFSMRFEDYNDFYQKLPKYLDYQNNYNNSGYKIFDSYHGKKTFKITIEHPQLRVEPKVFFDFKNRFFELITVLNSENWVDIENAYYEILISILNKESKYEYIGSIQRLNEEFEEIKDLLQYYLDIKINQANDFSNNYEDLEDICNLFNYHVKNLSFDPGNKFHLEFPPDYRTKLREFDMGFSANSNFPSSIKNLFLDFNYTQTVGNYIDVFNEKNERTVGKSSHIQIHGKLNDNDNLINFGFGDEMDENYNLLEKANNNDFLENIKSFMYFSNSNYKKLLHWIESGDFQVFIMGHSCGLSDRTMLNTIFEHTNCKSIKIFYHKKEDGSDNFKELSQNISRHFNKKALMRSKVVDKSLSVPLPQNIRFKSKTKL